MSVYRKRTLRQNDCFIVDGADFNFDEVTVATCLYCHLYTFQF